MTGSERGLDLFSDFVRNFSDAVFLVEIGKTTGKICHKVIEANNAAQELAGIRISTDQVIDIASILPQEIKTKTLEAMGKMSASSAPMDLGEVYMGDSANHRGWYDVKVVPLRPNIVGISFHSITSKKKLEEQLRRELILLRTVIDNIPDGIYAKNIEGRKIVTNPADLRNVGLHSEEEVLGKSDFELFSRETAERFGAHDRTVIQNGIPILNHEDFLIDSNGEKRWLLTSKVPLRDKEGKIIGLVGLGRDITSRKIWEERNSYLAAIVDSSNDAIIGMTLDSIVTSWNKGAERVYGYTHGEAIGRSASALLPSEHGNNILGIIKSIREGNHAQHYETISGKDDAMIYASVSVSPINGAGGEIIGAVWVARDITDRKRAEEELQNKERYQRALLDNFPFAVWMKDTESRFLAVNQLFAKSFNIPTADELVGKNDFDIVERRVAEEYRAHDRFVLASREKNILEQEIIGFEKGRWYETYKAPVIGKNDEPLGIVGFLRDITERKQTEEQVRKLYFAVEQSPVSIVITDIDGKIEYVNPKFTRLTGYTLQETVGKDFDILKSIENVPGRV